VFVEWHGALETMSDYEASYLDALASLGADNIECLDVSALPESQPRITLIAYRASSGSDPRVHQAVADACRRHGPPPSRLLVLACGLSNTPVSEVALSGSCNQHAWAHTATTTDLYDRVRLEVGTVARRIAVMGIQIIRPNPPQPLGETAEQGATPRKWRRWRA
jgi:hypothetical protein